MSSHSGLLRFITCGSVDDGKSTLIGRLLFDTKSILVDALSAIERTSKRRGLEAIDLSLITDGLQAEREQGITIDVAYRYFNTGTRKYIIADCPGHAQYTRNMVTGASTADLAIILIDARKGVLTQTKRHSYLASLMKIPNIIVAINKMDLVEYSEETFFEIVAAYREFAEELGWTDNITYIPMSALNGDNVVERGEFMDWYDGPDLLYVLENAGVRVEVGDSSLRFPVQYVCHPGGEEPRGYMGRIEAGDVTIGDVVMELPSYMQTTVKSIRVLDQQLESAHVGQSVSLTLADDLDISRGSMLVAAHRAHPKITKHVEAMICWLSETPLSMQRTYRLRHTTRDVVAKFSEISFKVDVNTMEGMDTTKLEMNDIARVVLSLAKPIFPDAYQINRRTGSFIVIDEATNNTVGAGMII